MWYGWDVDEGVVATGRTRTEVVCELNRRYGSVLRRRIHGRPALSYEYTLGYGMDDVIKSVSVFAEEKTDLTVGSFMIPVPWLQSINPIFIIAFAPIFAGIWSKLGDRAPSTPLKFAWALLGISLSFLIMIIPALDAESGAQVAVWWLVGVYLIQTWAELLLSPIGLSASTRMSLSSVTRAPSRSW